MFPYCLFVAYAQKLLPGKRTSIKQLYRNRRQIISGWFISIFPVRPANLPDAILRQADSGRTKLAKIAIFWRFSKYLRIFLLRYRLEILNEGKGQQVISLEKVSKHLVAGRLDNYTEKWPKMGKFGKMVGACFLWSNSATVKAMPNLI